MIWLSLAAVGILYYALGWWADKDNPARYEYIFGVVMIVMYSLPAGAGALIAAVVPRTGISARRRVGAVVLYLLSIVIVCLLDYFQYR